MLLKPVETAQGRLYFQVHDYNDGSHRYGAYLNLKTSIGGFTILDKYFNTFCEAALHYEELKAELLGYDSNPRSYIRMFV